MSQFSPWGKCFLIKIPVKSKDFVLLKTYCSLTIPCNSSIKNVLITGSIEFEI